MSRARAPDGTLQSAEWAIDGSAKQSGATYRRTLSALSGTQSVICRWKSASAWTREERMRSSRQPLGRTKVNLHDLVGRADANVADHRNGRRVHRRPALRTDSREYSKRV